MLGKFNSSIPMAILVLQGEDLLVFRGFPLGRKHFRVISVQLGNWCTLGIQEVLVNISLSYRNIRLTASFLWPDHYSNNQHVLSCEERHVLSGWPLRLFSSVFKVRDEFQEGVSWAGLACLLPLPQGWGGSNPQAVRLWHKPGSTKNDSVTTTFHSGAYLLF